MTLMPASESAELVALTAAGAPPPEATGRTITGWIVLWDVVGNTSAGPTIFLAGSIKLPADLSRVKMLLDHDSSQPAGYMIAAEELPKGIRGTFHCPEGSPAADLALREASSKLRDGLSVGAQIADYSFDAADRLVVKASELNETSLVSIPAFRDAIVTNVTASRKDRIVSRSKLLSIAASGSGAVEPPARDDAGDGAPAPVEQTTEQSTTTTTTTTTEERPGATSIDVEAARHVRAAAAAAPAPAEPRRELSLRAMSRLLLDTLKREDAGAALVNATLTAALNDVTPNNISTTDYGPKRPAWVTDLFTAADVARPLFDAFGPARDLTSLKVSGPVWDVRPRVQRYDGNKAPIPSNAISRRRLDATAQRFAGGWDVDRAFVDLPGDVDEIEDILTEAAKDYLTESEDWLREQVTAAQTPLYGGALTVPAALSMVGSYFSKIRGSRVGVVMMGEDAWDAFANMTEDAAPWWLSDAGSLSWTTSTATVGGMTFGVDNALAPTEILAADKRSVRLWEKNPIKVRAIDVANGGVDIGVFGYAAALPTDPRLIVNVDTAGRAEPA